ncbi:hypothetical protein [Azorhizobium sp. AG788]|uniref:hypothetical protein n=2 Tax=Azorhizobium TaxID=6 RepID=UPI00105BD1C7|nr:hypothetical protein [Azorhizobium sp. AG788]
MQTHPTPSHRGSGLTPSKWLAMGAGVALGVLAAWSSSARENELSGAMQDRDAMIGFLAQCIETGADGLPRFGDQAQGTCHNHSLGADEPMVWRKFDWPAQGDPLAFPTGYLANDAVVLSSGPAPLIAHIADFGDTERQFRRFDAGKGDGGQVVQIIDGAAYAIMTEDGGAGYQWFVGPGCRGAAGGLERFKSWLFFAADVTPGSWRQRIAELTMVRSASGCAPGFSQSLTRYRLEPIPVPLFALFEGKRQSLTALVPTIVSEHFARDTVRASDHLERFFLGNGLGMYRWERWEQRGRSFNSEIDRQSAQFAQSGRCPPLPFSTPPAPGWVMIDCRMWTNLIRQDDPWRASAFGWPGRLEGQLP